ncbi:MAG: DUF3327 domain-containing protein [Arthrobacter sp.]|jgi:enterochelin esterase family protein|nr:DUF3327 domain-containing protein [Arthrobacter sp.]
MRARPPVAIETPVLAALRAGVAPPHAAPAWPAVQTPGRLDAAGMGAPAGAPTEPPTVGELPAGTVAVTFAHEAPAGGEVLLHLNGITDRFRTAFEWALLPEVHRDGDRAVHAAAFALPAGLSCSYRLVSAPSIPRDAGTSRPGWKAIHEAGRPDPLAGERMPTVLGGESSLLALPGAVVHPAWHPATRPRRAAPRVHARGEGLRLIDTGRHDALVVLFDAEQWESVGLLEALRRLRGTPPMILAVDSDTGRRRAEFLPYPDRVEYVVLPAIEAVLATTPGLSRERIMASGQSYGGLAAVGLGTVGAAPARAVLASSPSLHFVPGHGRPQGLGETGELIERLRALPAVRAGSGARIQLAAGTEEHGMLEVARAAVPVLRAAGHEVSLTPVVGGHDYAWWRHALAAALEAW